MGAVGGYAHAQTAHERVESATIHNSFDAPSQDPDRRVYIANLRDCRAMVEDDEDITVTWTFLQAPPSGAEYGVKVQRGNETCDLASPVAEDSDTCTLLRSRRDFSGSSISETFRARTVFGISNPGECEGQSANNDLSLIFTKVAQLGEAETDARWSFDQVRLRLLTSRPSSPSELSFTPGESTIAVKWEGPEDVDTYAVYYSEEPFSVSAAPESLSDVRRHRATGKSASISRGISVGNTYYIAVTTIDDHGNESFFSEQVVVETQPVEDFWRRYRSAGGQEEGGYCAAASPSAAGFWLLALALVFYRRRRQEV